MRKWNAAHVDSTLTRPRRLTARQVERMQLGPFRERRILVGVREMSLRVGHVGLPGEDDVAVEEERLRTGNSHQGLSPQFAAFKVETADGAGGVEKADAFPVGDRWGSRAVAEAARQTQRMISGNLALPDRFPGRRVTAVGNDVLTQLGILRHIFQGREEESIFPDNDRALSGF